MALDKVKLGVLDGASTGVKSDRHTIPTVTTSQRDAGSFNAAVGDVIYNSTVGNLQQYTTTGWASVAAPPSISGLTYPTESGAVLTALDATGSSDAAQTLIINGSNFTSTVTVEIQVSGSFVAFASSTSVNGARNQVTCTGVTKRAAADNYTLRVTNSTGLDATTTVNFSADPSFSTAANLGTVYTTLTLNKSIAFTGTKVIQGATAKPTWMTVTGNTSTADNGSGDTTFDATGSPATLGGTIANSGTSQVHTFSIIVKDAENQTFNRDFSLTAVDLAAGGTLSTYTSGGTTYRVNKFDYTGSNQTFTLYAATTVDILVVAGGGGGGGGGGANDGAGGGGAGGMLTFPSQSLSAGDYTIVVGAGGTGGPGGANDGTNGGNSRFGTLTEVIGGGQGGYPGKMNQPTGGSGGGAAGSGGGPRPGGQGTSGQGNAGASNNDLRQTYSLSGSGGGGAGAAGEAQTAAGTSRGSNGGDGLANNYLTGSNITYAGGGGGAGGTGGNPGQVGAGSGGAGGGGNGGANNSGVAADGTDGLGGGGGGGANGSSYSNKGGDGGNGVVIVRYAI